MNQDRRNILTSLGIIVAGTGIVSTEAIALAGEPPEFAFKNHPSIPLLPHNGWRKQDAIADALEALAKSIRQRELVAQDLNVNSALKDEWLSHVVTVSVEMPRDAEGSRKEWERAKEKQG